MTSSIDRKKLVRRHNPVRHESNLISPMQVGNGHFAFGVDITGLQTFVPFATMSDWGWKYDPLPSGQTPTDFHGKVLSTHERDITYAIPNDDQKELSQWLISNPNRMNLGRIGLHFSGIKEDIKESDLNNCEQTLDLWTGTIHSSFEYKGQTIKIQTNCHPDNDTVGVRIDSPLIESGELSIFIDFPYNEGKSKFQAPYVGDWNKVDSHNTSNISDESSNHLNNAILRRDLDGTTYNVKLGWNQAGRLSRNKEDRQYHHRFIIDIDPSSATSSSYLEFCATFSKDDETSHYSYPSVVNASQSHWPSFWQNGGAIDLSQSTDPRWVEVERRLILGQYVMAVNAAGNDPPQESGLVNTGWYGKFHMEMVYWHGAYLALFNRWPILDRILSVYSRFLKSSIDLAHSQGYEGARWPKMTDPSGAMSPGLINSLLIWQMPHVMMFAEYDYRAHPNKETLQKWESILFSTAEFMASYASWNAQTGKFDLGPPLHVVSENTDSYTTYNSAFELQYWRFGLSVAQKWRQRLGFEISSSWEKILHGLASPTVKDGLYVIWPEIEDMWTKYNWEHPALVGMYGWLPENSGLDMKIMKATTEKIWETWQFNKCWGWDFGMLAMNAARMGNPERAIEFLLDPNMPFDDVGLAPGGSQVPFPYLPATGSYILAVGFMAAGWDSDDGRSGFPQGFKVISEGLNKAI